jgi:hypothetical protein
MGWLVAAALAGPVWAADPSAGTAATGDEAGTQSLSDINKKLTNPVSDLWSITFQQNNFRIDPGPGEGNRWSSNVLFQPVLPVAISPDWNLITRPVVPLFVSTPRPDPEPGDPFNIGRSQAFGDTTLLQLVAPSPKLAGNWLLGFGPSWIFPTAGSDFTGQDKYQVGPAALVGYLSEKWILGGLYQEWWSFSGSDRRPATSQMNFQPVAAYFLADGWSVGYSGNVLADWKNSQGSDWTVPIGMSVAKVAKLGKLPVRFALGLQWMAVQPDLYGQKWNLQLIIAPVLPKLIRGNLTDPGHMEFGLPR